MRTIRTWWGRRFIEALEAFTDSARLARGRGYANNDRVKSWKLEKGGVNARIRGNVNPYYGVYEEPTYQTVLNPTSPETCQTVAVPVCLPACCQGCPCETSRCTLLGCGQVRYDYACGCSVIIRFAKHGDINVTYVGF